MPTKNNPRGSVKKVKLKRPSSLDPVRDEKIAKRKAKIAKRRTKRQIAADKRRIKKLGDNTSVRNAIKVENIEQKRKLKNKNYEKARLQFKT